MKNIVIMLSGRGSNMQAIAQACQVERWPARVAAVVSNRPDALALAFAREQGIATVPSVLATELLTNPFLRSHSPGIINALQKHHKLEGPVNEVSVFTAVRLWKNTF